MPHRENLEFCRNRASHYKQVYEAFEPAKTQVWSHDRYTDALRAVALQQHFEAWANYFEEQVWLEEMFSRIS